MSVLVLEILILLSLLMIDQWQGKEKDSLRIFRDVVKEMESPLLRYVSRLIGNLNAEAEDFVQETFLKLHKTVINSGWETITHPKQWLYRVAHNLVMDSGRRKQLENRYKNSLVEGSQQENLVSVGEHVKAIERKELGQRALKALEKLPLEEKEIILLKIMEGLTLKEISEIQDSNIGRVAYQLNKGLKRLAEELAQNG